MLQKVRTAYPACHKALRAKRLSVSALFEQAAGRQASTQLYNV